MPELPEVETIKEALRKAVEGAVIQKVIVRNRKFRIPVPADFEDTLEGAAILKIYRIAKYAVLDLDNGFSVVWHFGMSGKVKITALLYHMPKPCIAKKRLFTAKFACQILFPVLYSFSSTYKSNGCER